MKLRFIALSLSLIGIVLLFHQSSDAELKPTTDRVQSKEVVRRKKLWDAFDAVCPKELRPIEVYCEDDDQTTILFRSRGKDYFYTLGSEKVKENLHQKLIIRINCITFRNNTFTLWRDGQVELESVR